MSNIRNLIMPKGDGTLEALNYSLEVYFKNSGDWVKNEEFKNLIHHKFGYLEKKDAAFLVKKAEVAKYFGLIDYNHKKRIGKITERGKRYFLASNEEKLKIIFEAVINDKFGKENCVVPSSDSDIDPPKVLLKTSYDIDGITKYEFGCMLYMMHNLGLSYTQALRKLKEYKLNKNLDELIQEITNNKLNKKYFDVKFVVYFNNIGIVKKDKDQKYRLTDFVSKNYDDLISQLNCYNTGVEMETIEKSPNEEVYESSENYEKQNINSSNLRFSLTAVTPDTIASINEESEYTSGDEGNTSFDLSHGINMRRQRTLRHNTMVKNIATVIYENGFSISRGNIDCLGIKESAPLLLIEVKTLDGTEGDERNQVMKAFSQLFYYEEFAMGEYVGKETKKIIVLENKISQQHIDFLEKHEIIMVWLDKNNRFTGTRNAKEFFLSIGINLN